MASVKNAAAKGIGQAITERPTAIDLKASFDSATNTITLTTTKTDFQALYEEMYAKEQGKSLGNGKRGSNSKG